MIIRRINIARQPSWPFDIPKAEGVPTCAKARTRAMGGIKPKPYGLGHQTWTPSKVARSESRAVPAKFSRCGTFKSLTGMPADDGT